MINTWQQQSYRSRLAQLGTTGVQKPEVALRSPRDFSGNDGDQSESAPACVSLTLEDLKCFEVVDTQFQSLGVTFRNAIALHPSNPAYPAHSGNIVLLAAPKSGWLEATFSRPVRVARGFVTSSRQATLTAYDYAGTVLAQAEIPTPNLAGSNAPTPPNAELSVEVTNIHRIVFSAFGGELTVDGFGFSFW
ncbi:MAG: hypothetical protein KME16_17915 [Scytolyngbya sp. HA4215-MV1]|jgi:hypothetical protein|nr:hypothetical protein [Scytolyngbya sp. HA4215-MV1]